MGDRALLLGDATDEMCQFTSQVKGFAVVVWGDFSTTHSALAANRLLVVMSSTSARGGNH
jgi:hypothetical protein